MKLGAVLLGVAALAFAGVAAAESDEDRATARQLADEGQAAFDRRDYPTALDRFTRARKLVPAPTIGLALARTQAAMGRLVQAHESYERVIVDGPGPKPSAAFERAVDDARAELAALEPRIPYVTVIVEAAGDTGAGKPANARVVIDEDALAPAAVGVKRAVNPGRHVARASAPGFRSASRAFDLGDGASESVTVALEPDAPTTAPLPRRGPLLRAIGYAALGGAGDALLVGVATAGLALDRKSTLASRCPAGRCAPADATAVHAYEDTGALAWTGGGAAIALGGIGAAALAATASKPTGETERPLVPALVGAGATGVAFGAMAGVMSLNLKHELDAACASGVCPSSDADGVTGYRAVATTSIVSLAAGGSFLVAGAAVALVAKTPASTGALEPFVGLGAAGVRGTFE